MNIFILDTDPVTAALYHNDAHCIKMTLETAQMLSTVHRLHGNINPKLYKSTHFHHPCVKWLMESRANYDWTYRLFVALANQYHDRYDKTHASYRYLGDILTTAPSSLPDVEMTPFALAMPDKYKKADAVESYRAYYIGDKARFSTWRHPATVPHWFRLK